MVRIALVCTLVAFASAAAADDGDLPHWKPGKATIAKLDFAFRNAGKWHGSPPDLTNVDRYYAGVTIKGRRMVRAEFAQATDITDCTPIGDDGNGHHISSICVAAPRKGEIRIVPKDRFPQAKGGGCSFVTMLYDVGAERMVELECNAPE